MSTYWLVEESEKAIEAMVSAQVSAWKVSTYSTMQNDEALATKARSAATAADRATELMRELNVDARAKEPRS